MSTQIRTWRRLRNKTKKKPNKIKKKNEKQQGTNHGNEEYVRQHSWRHRANPPGQVWNTPERVVSYEVSYKNGTMVRAQRGWTSEELVHDKGSHEVYEQQKEGEPKSIISM